MQQESESLTPTPYAVRCPLHGLIYLTYEEYCRQMDQLGQVWKCPHFVGTEEAIRLDGGPAASDSLNFWHGPMIGPCGKPAHFDDDTYEGAMRQLELFDGERLGVESP